MHHGHRHRVESTPSAAGHGHGSFDQVDLTASFRAAHVDATGSACSRSASFGPATKDLVGYTPISLPRVAESAMCAPYVDAIGSAWSPSNISASARCTAHQHYQRPSSVACVTLDVYRTYVYTREQLSITPAHDRRADNAGGGDQGRNPLRFNCCFSFAPNFALSGIGYNIYDHKTLCTALLIAGGGTIGSRQATTSTRQGTGYGFTAECVTVCTRLGTMHHPATSTISSPPLSGGVIGGLNHNISRLWGISSLAAPPNTMQYVIAAVSTVTIDVCEPSAPTKALASTLEGQPPTAEPLNTMQHVIAAVSVPSPLTCASRLHQAKALASTPCAMYVDAITTSRCLAMKILSLCTSVWTDAIRTRELTPHTLQALGAK